MTFLPISIIAAGGAIGAVLRYFTMTFFGRIFGTAFPYSTLAVNIIGSLLMGVLIGVLARFISESQNIHLFLAVGMLGSFTTFSTFSLDVIVLFERGELLNAFYYVILSVLLSISALFLGISAMRFLLQT